MIHETGGPEVLRIEEVDRPQPADGEVLVRVRAAGVNPIEWKYRRGLMPRELPAVLGSDVSGTIELSRTEEFRQGEEVFGLVASGAYAEYARARPATLARRPPAVSDVQAAALPVAGMTAWQALLDRGALQRGQRALIAGAAGGVGHLAVQIARHAGAHVIGTGSARNREFVLGLGADGYVDYASEDVAEAAADVDLAFDTVGGETTASLLAAVRRGGALITIAGAPPQAEAAAREVRAELLVMSPSAEQLGELASLVASGEVRVEVAETIPLQDVSRAHALSEAGHTRGKLVLRVAD